jgi:hypothetical protein
MPGDVGLFLRWGHSGRQSDGPSSDIEPHGLPQSVLYAAAQQSLIRKRG